MRQQLQRARLPEWSGTIQLPHSAETHGTAPVASKPLRVSKLRNASRARFSRSTLLPTEKPSPPALFPPSSAAKLDLRRNNCTGAGPPRVRRGANIRELKHGESNNAFFVSGNKASVDHDSAKEGSHSPFAPLLRRARDRTSCWTEDTQESPPNPATVRQEKVRRRVGVVKYACREQLAPSLSRACCAVGRLLTLHPRAGSKRTESDIEHTTIMAT